ncbi:MAG: PAS domain S-box protein [Planctomycetes bacterium]|nr:PAS domain S-box protein [Planctomycetota bacterium]
MGEYPKQCGIMSVGVGPPRPFVRDGNVKMTESGTGNPPSIEQVQRLQRLLEQGPSQIRQIIDLVPHRIFIKDAAGRFVLVNQALADAYHRTVEEMIGLHHADVHPIADQVQLMLDDDRDVIERGVPKVIDDMALTNHRGQTLHFQVTKVPFRFADKTVGVLGIATNITDLKKAELALRKAHDQLGDRARKSAVELDRYWAMSPDLLCTADFEGRFTRINPAWRHTLGYDDVDLLTHPYIEFVHPDDQERTLAEAASIYEGNITRGFENRYRCKDGSYRWLVWNTSVVPEEKTIYAVARDVTDRREAEQRFRTLVSNLPGAVYRCACDEHWTMQFLSNAIESIAGYPVTDFIDNRVRSYASIIHPDDVAMVDQLVQDGVRKHQPYDLEYRIVHEDGNIRWVYEKGQGVFDHDGRLLFLDGAIFDITEQKLAQKLIEQRTKELARSNADLEEFAYAASHDLRAPLRAIANLSEWIEEDAGPSLSDDARSHLSLLRRRVNRMQRLIDDLLTYSRATRQHEQAERVDVAKLLEDVIFLLNPPGTFTIRIQPGMPAFHTDKAPLSQVFTNLIGNAVKHHDKPDGRIDINVTDEGAFYRFTIRDDGPGIPLEFRERIFKMFHTLRSRDEVETSGVGLALVKKLVERRGGRVWVESAEARGSMFHFTWPKSAEESHGRAE